MPEKRISLKGFGSENKSAIKMLKPTASEKDIIDFVTEVVKLAGPDACPPYVLGIGIGGTFDHAAHLSKRAFTASRREGKRRLASCRADAAVGLWRSGSTSMKRVAKSRHDPLFFLSVVAGLCTPYSSRRVYLKFF